MTRDPGFLTFDCHGTLVDWESGIAEAVAGVAAEHGLSVTRDEVLHLHAEIEPRIQGGTYTAPATESGIAAIWINRRGETTPAAYREVPQFPDLGALADSLRGGPPVPGHETLQ